MLHNTRFLGGRSSLPRGVQETILAAPLTNHEGSVIKLVNALDALAARLTGAVLGARFPPAVACESVNPPEWCV